MRIWWEFDFVWNCRPVKAKQKLPVLRIFHLNTAGYWLKFSTSNNRVSVVPHQLRYCHCAKLINLLILMLLINSARHTCSVRKPSLKSSWRHSVLFYWRFRNAIVQCFKVKQSSLIIRRYYRLCIGWITKLEVTQFRCGDLPTPNTSDLTWLKEYIFH